MRASASRRALLRTALTWNSATLIEQDLLGVNRVSSHNRGQTAGPADVFKTTDGCVHVPGHRRRTSSSAGAR